MAKRSFAKTLVWEKITCSFDELNLAVTLSGGQSFRWHKSKDDRWRGVFAGHVWSIKQDDSGNLLYQVHNMPSGNKARKKRSVPENSVEVPDFVEILRDYFRLDVNLKELFDEWSVADENFKLISNRFPGVRILRQDPVENLFSFICSSNNNIQRITSMVEKLCSKYGKVIHKDGEDVFYSFPTIEALSGDSVEGELRTLGFGYRAKYISQTAKYVTKNHSADWLQALRKAPYEEAHEALVKLPGVGAKVADCICLMSLDKLCAIPVDTHVWQITVRDYLPHLKTTKSLTDKIYKQIGDFYRERFGTYAGWANTVLFAADLRQFKDHNKEKKKK